MNLKLTFLIIFLFSMASCYYDVEEILYPPVDCETLDMSYDLNIEPILDQNCYVCHSAAANQGGISLEGYSSLKIYINNGRLLGAIRHDAGFSQMPQGAPKLLDCDISKIEAWIDDGALNN